MADDKFLTLIIAVILAIAFVGVIASNIGNLGNILASDNETVSDSILNGTRYQLDNN